MEHKYHTNDTPICRAGWNRTTYFSPSPDSLLYLSLLAAPYPFIEFSHSPKAIRRFADKAAFCHFSPLPLSSTSQPGTDMPSPQWTSHALSVYSSWCSPLWQGAFGQAVFRLLQPRAKAVDVHNFDLAVLRRFPADTYRTPVSVGECVFCTTEPETACSFSFPESLWLKSPIIFRCKDSVQTGTTLSWPMA